MRSLNSSHFVAIGVTIVIVVLILLMPSIPPLKTEVEVNESEVAENSSSLKEEAISSLGELEKSRILQLDKLINEASSNEQKAELLDSLSTFMGSARV